MTAPTCATCRWWAVPWHRRPEVSSASCKRYPPQLDPNYTPFGGPYKDRQSNPRTYAHDWCGEHAPS